MLVENTTLVQRLANLQRQLETCIITEVRWALYVGPTLDLHARATMFWIILVGQTFGQCTYVYAGHIVFRFMFVENTRWPNVGPIYLRTWVTLFLDESLLKRLRWSSVGPKYTGDSYKFT